MIMTHYLLADEQSFQQITVNEKEEGIDVSDLPMGTYLFELWQNGQLLKVERVVKFVK